MDAPYFLRRPDDEADPVQPLIVRSVANRTFNAWDQEDYRFEDYHKIQWCVSGSAEIRLGGKVLQLNQDQFIHYPPHTEHWARAGEHGWHCCWLTFTNGISDAIFAAFGLEGIGIYHAGPCPIQGFSTIADAMSGIGSRADQEAGCAAYQLLATAAASSRPHLNSDGSISAAVNFIQQNWHETDFSIDELAQHCRMHRSQLSRLFTQAIGLAPSRYLTRLRLQHAASLLLDGELHSTAIAERCGFKDSSYFARVFRKAYGVSPQEYRHAGSH